MNWIRLRIFLLALVAAFAGTLLPAEGIGQDKAPSAAKSASQIDFQALLPREAEYCRKLEASILDFFCREEVEETIDITLEANKPNAPINQWTYFDLRTGQTIFYQPGKVGKFKNTFVYDYQCIRRDRVITETRTLLKEGKEKRNEPNAQLKLSGFFYFNSLLSPVNLFGESSQPDYDYQVVGRERFESRPVIVVEVKPKAGVVEPKCLSGKAWIEPGTADILKMELTQRPSGGLEVFAKREAQYKRKLRLTLRTEFSAEKNGIRFPSRLLIEEAYLNDQGRAFVRSKTNIVYTNFKFFTVATESRIIK